MNPFHTKSILAALAALAISTVAASAVGTPVNWTINLGAGTATQHTTASGGVAPRAIDGNTSGGWSSSTITHTAPGDTDPWWQVEMPSNFTVSWVQLYNRTDSCCSARLSDITVEILDASSTVVYTSPLLNPGNAGNPVGPNLPNGVTSNPADILLDLGQNVTGRIIKVRRDPASTLGSQGVLSLAEVTAGLADAMFPSGTDLTQAGIPGVTVAQAPNAGAPPGGGVPERAIDGNFTNFTHTDGGDVDQTWEVDFATDLAFEQVILFNRTNCCGERLRDITITVLDSGGGTVASSPVLNPANVEGFSGGSAPPGTTLMHDFAAANGGNPVLGQKIVVTRTWTSGLGNVLSLGEVSVVGSSYFGLDEEGGGTGDGMGDIWEEYYGLDTASDDSALDLDSDGLTNIAEFDGTGVPGFDGGAIPNAVDTDGDTLSDGDEVNHPTDATDPTDADSDDDNLDDAEELVTGDDGFITNPNLADTDIDGVRDDLDVDPTDPLSDSDSDGIGDLAETTGTSNPFGGESTDPLDADSDDDGLTDGEEVDTLIGSSFTSDPNLIDTDSDGIDDLTEVTYNSDPNDANIKPFVAIPEILGTGTASLLGGDLTDPENDGAPGPAPTPPATWADPPLNWNWVDINASSKAQFGSQGAYDVFDNDASAPASKWCCNGPPQQITVQLMAPAALTHFTLTSSGDSAQRDPRVFQILGSTDGTNFTPIYSRDLPGLNIFDARYQVVRFQLPAPAAPYTWFRYSVTGTNSTEHALAEIEYFGATDTTTDTDLGGIPDYYEDHFPATILDKALIADDTADYDGDGLNNLGEFQNGTNPDGVDTDGDGLTDGQEVNGVVVGSKTYTSNPLSQDTDGDGLLDGDEVNGIVVGMNTYTSDPDDTDTDDDGYDDGLEIAEGSDPDDDTSKPSLTLVSVIPGLIGGDITDPEDDGIEAPNPANPIDWSYLHNWNWADISASVEANFSGFGSSEASFDIFDNKIGGGEAKWYWSGGLPVDVTLEFLAPYSLTHFTMTSSNDTPGRDPRDWRLEGSDDGIVWDVIYPIPGSNDDPSGAGSGLWTARDQTLRFDLPIATPSYSLFRFVCETTGNGQIALSEMELFGIRDNTDSDGGGVPDWFEQANGMDWENVAGNEVDDTTDIDFDGLTSLEEYNLGSPLSELGTNPNDDDSDDDGIKDGEEVAAGGGADGFVTNPFNPDTDGDGMPDGWETTYAGLNPTVVDSAGDLELDDLTNGDEYTSRTNPLVSDTDGDTLGDGAEVNGDPVNGYTSDPAVQDTDGDGLRDDAEVNGDPSYGFTSDPELTDTDSDQYPDAFEVFKGTDPDDAIDFPALDPITWGSAQDITGNLSDIDTTGTLVHAWNGGASTIKVGGTDFVPGPSLGSSATGIDPYNRGNDQDYEDLLDEVSYNGTVAPVRLLEIPGLTIGASYQIQVWVADTRPGTENRMFTFDTVDPTQPAVTLNAGDAADPAEEPGQFAIGTFTANSTSAFLNVEGVGVGPHYTAIMVRRIGDPGPYYDWATGFTPFPGGPDDNGDSDTLSNLLEFGFGTNPIVSDNSLLSWNGVNPVVPGTPVIDLSYPGGGGVDFMARFMRRKDGSAAYTLEFSADLTDWQTSDDLPAPAWYDPADLVPRADDASGDYELVEYPYPLFFDGKKVRFFRVTVTAVP